jgi:hypothetical protein
MGNTTASPLWGADRTVTSSPEAFLTPGLAATTANFAARLGVCGAPSSAGQLGGDYLMENVQVRLDAKNFGVEFDIAILAAVSLEKGGLYLSHVPSPPP